MTKNDQESSEIKNSSQKASGVTMVVNGLLALIKGVFGVLFNSSALIADAFHSLSDILSSGIVFLGLYFAQKPADDSHHYGHGKLEAVASKVVALLLIVTAIALGYNAVNLFFSSPQVPGSGALIGAVLSIMIKELLYRYNMRMSVKFNSSALKADAWHNRSDAITSVAALIGIGGAQIGFPVLDPLGALVVSFLILKVGIDIYLNSIKELIDTAPTPHLIKEIERIIFETEGIENVHDIKARHHGSDIFVDIKVCVKGDRTVAEGHHYAGVAKHQVLRDLPEIKNVLIHVNPCDSQKACHECDRLKITEEDEYLI